MELKSSLESKYGALRGHLTFEYQVILIGTRASDQPADGGFLRFVLPADNDPKVEGSSPFRVVACLALAIKSSATAR